MTTIQASPGRDEVIQRAKTLIDELRDLLAGTDWETKDEIVGMLRDVACTACGNTDLPCYCMRDD